MGLWVWGGGEFNINVNVYGKKIYIVFYMKCLRSVTRINDILTVFTKFKSLICFL